MATSTDYLIVGSGLTGAVLARILADAGRDVLVLDRRDHIGGNVYDETHSSGIRIQVYGPHFFRTNSPGVWEFVRRYAEFYPYEHEVITLVDGKLEAWPVTDSYLQRVIGDRWKPDFTGTPTNFEEASLSMMPRIVYEKFVRDYTRKQWGVEPTALDAGLAKRFDVHKDDDRRMFQHRFQGLPRAGYTALMTRILEGIDLRTGIDYLTQRREFKARKKLIFTGPIDEFFDFNLGKLVYRGQNRDSEFLPDVSRHQVSSVVNYPSFKDADFVRKVEWKHLMEQSEREHIQGTLLTTETPFSPQTPNEYEYPFPDKPNAELYTRYRTLADQLQDVLICGRLGEYRYLDMDQAIGRAFMLANRKLGLDVPLLDEESIAAIPTRDR